MRECRWIRRHRPDLAPSPPAIIWGHFVVVQEVHSPLELWRLSSHACGQAVQAEFPKDDRLKKQPQKVSFASTETERDVPGKS